MKVIDLSGKEHKLDIRKSHYDLKKSEKASKSKLQFECGQLLLKHFGSTPILEEVSIPGERLYLDFLLPTLRIAFEIHGQQHDTYNEFFHKNKMNFKKSQDRDNRKRIWCELNEIELIEIRSINELKEILEK